MAKKSRLQEHMEEKIEELLEAAEECDTEAARLIEISATKAAEANNLQAIIDAAAPPVKIEAPEQVEMEEDEPEDEDL